DSSDASCTQSTPSPFGVNPPPTRSAVVALSGIVRLSFSLGEPHSSIRAKYVPKYRTPVPQGIGHGPRREPARSLFHDAALSAEPAGSSRQLPSSCGSSRWVWYAKRREGQPALT